MAAFPPDSCLALFKTTIYAHFSRDCIPHSRLGFLRSVSHRQSDGGKSSIEFPPFHEPLGYVKMTIE